MFGGVSDKYGAPVSIPCVFATKSDLFEIEECVLGYLGGDRDKTGRKLGQDWEETVTRLGDLRNRDRYSRRTPIS